MLNTPHIIEDDDDEFDWEAAVREIDVACERGGSTAAASTSVSAFSRKEENLFRFNSRKPSAVSRQSTLDRFIQNHQSINPRNVGDFREDNIRNVVAGVGVGVGGGGGEDTADDNDFGDDNSGGCYCKIDLEAAKTWIYPVNIPLRNYQLSITRTALFQNTLVALPTGLGKTFIAAVVMYNYFRWFPEGKIVFAAPSRPLVLQQIEACHNIVGIPQEWAIDLTGQTSPSKRACLWKDKRVFFVTPQVLEKDIQSGICLTKYIVCLVIDEAHRASGNYSYCVAIREMMAAGLQFRLLALTATPGSKQETIQNVIDNLQISKMEYRTEGDRDVRPYVHNRKQELIRVAMGNDADEINKILLDIIRPFVEKLLSRGVFFNRGIQTLSPLELVNTREKFRGAPRLDLSQLQRDEVERWFSVLIALCHLRKVLSGHGIRPAYEFLQEKLQQGYFANLMSKNELIWKIKLKMQRSLSQGAPSPKLLKMIDILTDHFKTNDPRNSRVIIFSHYRSSVRDIMNSLSSIGDYVKATEFIGQSSGKTLKGQTQKIQQAVLQKFRDGGYNIIVATSIGEEGLDIMEVDLIISFDANISPLRMIQRMGRTGRKRDGRVVILACEGPEINGFLRKQATSKTVKRYMHDGGEKALNFTRVLGCDRTFQDKLSDAEAELIVKYFRSSDEQTWKPSLIAFPHFQAFPSRVHSVTHSLRTRMLIGTMQHLQALSSLDSKALPVEVQVQDNKSSSQCLRAESVAQDYSNEKDSVSFHGSLGTHSEKKTSKPEASGAVIFSCTEKLYVSAPPSQDLPMHCFLFEATYVSVNPFGTVSITSVPSLPFVKAVPSCKNTEGNYTDLLNIVKPKSSPPWISAGDHCELKLPSKINLTNPTETNGIYNCYMSSSRLCNSNGSEEAVLQEVENVFSTPTSKKSCIDSEVIIAETPANKRTPVLLDDKSTNDVNDIEMSPRLTNMVENGVVPESPLGEIGNHSSNGHTVRRDSNSEHVNCAFIPNCSREDGNELPKDKLLHSSDLPNCELKTHSLSPVNAPFAFRSGLPLKKLSSEMTEYVKDCKSASASEYICGSPINIDPHTPLVEMHNCVNARGNMSGSPVNEKTRTPLVNLTNSCSNDWKLSSGEASNSIQQAPKFKRLRKYGEFSKKISSETMKDKLTGPTSILIRSTTRRNPGKHIEGKRKMAIQAKAFIEEEAEVSSDAEVSEDEEEDNDNSNDDSFIDDRINPTMDTQAEAVRSDMMAIYRRSLLSQSPVESPPCCSSDLNPSIMQCIAEVYETGSCSSEEASHSFQTPQTGLQSAVRSSNLCQMDSVELSRGNIPTETSAASREERKVEGRKRKLTFQQVGYDPETSIQPQRLFQSEATGELSLQCQSENNKHDEDVFSDDQFYEGLDLDALEAQATMLLKCKSDLPVDRKQYVIPDPLTEKNQNISDSPSFDLGI